jgi:hypothetical protein
VHKVSFCPVTQLSETKYAAILGWC